MARVRPLTAPAGSGSKSRRRNGSSTSTAGRAAAMASASFALSPLPNTMSAPSDRTASGSSWEKQPHTTVIAPGCLSRSRRIA